MHLEPFLPTTYFSTMSANFNLNFDLNSLIANCQNRGRAEAVQNLLNETEHKLRTTHPNEGLHILILSLSQSQ